MNMYANYQTQAFVQTNKFISLLWKENDRTIMRNYRRVAIVEDFWSILEQAHNRDCVHAGVRKTFAEGKKCHS